MFQKTERFSIEGIESEPLLRQLATTLEDGFAMPCTSTEASLTTTQTAFGNYVYPVVTAKTFPSKNGFFIDIEVKNTLPQNDLILFIVVLVLFWPAAAFLAYQTHTHFEREAERIFVRIREVVGKYAR